MFVFLTASFTSLIGCALTWKCCDHVGLFLSSKSSGLKQLDLSMNNLQDSGVLVFSTGLGNPQCKLETLRSVGFCTIKTARSNVHE